MSLLHRRQGNFRADYTYTVEGSIIAIVDLDQGNRSVTNDMDNVIQNIKRELNSTLAGYAIVYRDSLGIWDGVKLDERGGVTFYVLCESEQDKATQRLLHLVP